MARTSAPGGTSTMVPRAGGAAPRNTGPVGTAGPRRRHTPSRSTSSGGAGVQGGMGSGAGMLRFYTDDAPGLRITPVVVLVMSLCFIGFVTILHVIGKIYTVRA
mmetsp:Transcript_35672/g.68412  ORF Transcript_35672/g.68412 Transcript_35672/m.68412 type:complete len:104 (+) Transcript_35672:155-466(+)